MSKKFSKLSIRMKAYEHNSSSSLIKKLPVLFRIDGKNFHSFTRGLKKPFDRDLMNTLNYAGLQLAKEVEGLQLLFLQSDEISGLILDVQQDSTQAWFDYNLQKLQSVLSSIFSVHFNIQFRETFKNDNTQCNKVAFTDCRAWNLPFDSVVDYFNFRQDDAIKNAISMIAREHYSDKELFQKNTKEIKEMLLMEKNIDVYNSLHVPQDFLNGRCIIKIQKEIDNSFIKTYKNQPEKIIRNFWIVDDNIPVFKNNPEYIEKYFREYFTESDTRLFKIHVEILTEKCNNFYKGGSLIYDLGISDRYIFNKISKNLLFYFKVTYPELKFKFLSYEDSAKYCDCLEITDK